MVLVSSWCFWGKWLWIWCSADNNISSCWIFMKSGSKIRLKKFNFQSYFLSNHILFVTMASTLDLQYGQSWYVWWKMPFLTAMIVTDFLVGIPHLNYQINIRECFDTIDNIRGGHAPGHHDLHIKFSNLLWLIPQIGNFLRYNRDSLYISLSKVQWCVHGHWIHMQRSCEVNAIITSVFWFNLDCSIYVKDIMMIFLSTIVPSWWKLQISDLGI